MLNRFIKDWFYRRKTLSKLKNLLCAFFVFCMMFGFSFQIKGNWNLIFGNPLSFVLSLSVAAILFCCFQFAFLKAEDLTRRMISLKQRQVQKDIVFRHWKRLPKRLSTRLSSLSRAFDCHPFMVSFMFILLAWLVYMVAFYPIILSPDPSFQIRMFFNVPTKYIDWVIQRDPNVFMTTHHPVIHTGLLGISILAGRALGSDNLGLFFYSVLQTLTLASALSSTVAMAKKSGIARKFRVLLLIIYMVVPMFPFYAMSGVKDTFYTSFTIFYVMMLYDFVTFYRDKKIPPYYLFGLWMVIFLAAAFRNNGFYVIFLSLPAAVIFLKRNRFRLGAVLLFFAGCYFLYTKALIPALGISDGSIREVLSVPFQQTARYVKEHGDELSSEDIAVIDKILGYEDLAERYDPELADNVKNQFNKYTTTEDMKEYFLVWGKGLMRHPDTYIQATMNNTYGYFYPGAINWYLYSKFDSRITEDNLVDYHYNDLKWLRSRLSRFGLLYPFIPVIGWISNMAFSCWVMLTLCVYLLEKRRRRYLLVMLPLLLSLLVCVVSPANTYFRYAMPYVFTMPALTMLLCRQMRTKYTQINTGGQEQ